MSKVLELVSGTLRIAVIAAIIPFFANFTTIRNGIYRDYVAISAGGIAILLALIALATVLKEDAKGARLGIVAVVVLIGVYQLAKGFGFIQLTT